MLLVQEPLHGRNFAFWEWFYSILKLTKDWLQGQWKDRSVPPSWFPCPQGAVPHSWFPSPQGAVPSSTCSPAHKGLYFLLLGSPAHKGAMHSS